MAITYNSLLSLIQSYLQRTDADTINHIPTFITLAEHQLATDLKSLGIEDYINGVFTPGVVGGAVIQKPGAWRRTISFNYGSGTNNNTRITLEPRSYEFLIDFWPDRTQLAPPQFYADYGFNYWLVAPTPDQAYPFEIAFMQLPQPLNVNVQTNWYTNYAPHAILYGSLLQAQGFVRNSEMIPLWKEWYEKAVAGLNQQNNQRIYDRSTKRDSD